MEFNEQNSSHFKCSQTHKDMNIEHGFISSNRLIEIILKSVGNEFKAIESLSFEFLSKFVMIAGHRTHTRIFIKKNAVLLVTLR